MPRIRSFDVHLLLAWTSLSTQSRVVSDVRQHGFHVRLFNWIRSRHILGNNSFINPYINQTLHIECQTYIIRYSWSTAVDVGFINHAQYAKQNYLWYTVECRFNAVQYIMMTYNNTMTLATHIPDFKITKDTHPYRVYVVRIFQKIDTVITAPHCARYKLGVNAITLDFHENKCI